MRRPSFALLRSSNRSVDEVPAGNRTGSRLCKKVSLYSAAVLVGLFAASPEAARASEPSADRVRSGAIKPSEPVKIDTGTIRGELACPSCDIAVFRGIPYAAPPLGSLRWRPPAPPKAWDGVRDCSTFGAAAPQKPVPLLATFPGMTINSLTNEDCLYLNVWAPAHRPPVGAVAQAGSSEVIHIEGLPVMVWIHGGGYTFGADSQPLYEGTNLARRGVIVVGMNYRLGVLGYMAHPDLSAESEHGVSGNYGLLDQIEALKWVQRNIAAFGGDPKRVTIFGESAGGNAVYALLLSPLAQGLFQRAIPESGGTFTFPHLKKAAYDRPSAEAMGVEFAKKCGVTDGAGQLAALRALPVDKLLNATVGLESSRTIDFRNGGMRLAPIVDGWAIPHDPMTAFQQGNANPVPLLVGANGNEGSMFTLISKMPANGEEFTAILDRDFGSHFADAFKKAYPPGQAKKSLTELLGDFSFVAPARAVARIYHAPAFLYNFDHPSPGAMGKMLGAHHGAEIAYVFDNLQLGKEHTAVDEKLRDLMTGYWIQFAKTGNPNREGLPEWPTYSVKDDRCLVITDKAEAVQHFRKDRLDAIDGFMEAWHNNSPEVARPHSAPDPKHRAATDARSADSVARGK